MESKARDYLRDLSDKKIQNLKARYANHVKISRSGFLNTNQKERLLRITKWGRNSTNPDVYRLFSDIRKQATSAIRDFQLLSEVLNEDQLEKIFIKTEKIDIPKITSLNISFCVEYFLAIFDKSSFIYKFNV